MKRFLPFLLAIVLMISFTCACQKKGAQQGNGNKLQVITTIFPLYDFAREIAGDRAEVTMLLPPGMEPHSFEPKPEDIFRVGKADIFVYTDIYMEPWATDLVKGVGNDKLLVIDSGKGARFLPATGKHDQDEVEDEHDHHHGEGMDPHIWLDFANAQLMVANIAEGLAQKDPANRSYYLKRADAYNKRLGSLDAEFRKRLGSCASRVFLHGGHYAFGYLAARYGLEYRAAYAISANAEPTPRRIAEIIKLMRSSGQKAVFYEELISPVMAETIARETGAALLKLHGAHNVSREELNRGVDFISIMESNLNSLSKGLQCR